MGKIINKLLEILGLNMLVVIGWQALEILIIGHINPNKIDTFVGIILTLSLYKNLKNIK